MCAAQRNKNPWDDFHAQRRPELDDSLAGNALAFVAIVVLSALAGAVVTVVVVLRVAGAMGTSQFVDDDGIAATRGIVIALALGAIVGGLMGAGAFLASLRHKKR